MAMAMAMRQLGRVGPEVSAIGLGCMPMSGSYGSAAEADGIAAIHRALDLGINLLDTADVYGAGHNEKLVGRAILGPARRGRTRHQVRVRGRCERPPGRRQRAPGVRARGLRGEPDAAGVDTIDLYQQHRVDPETPIEDDHRRARRARREGKVRFIGLSEALAPDLRRAAAVHPITSLQSEYSLLERGRRTRGPSGL
jgi:aryl-alcohol dehydrogenase-like predicted oxidoreductase